MFTYTAKILDVLDGDTVDALVDLGMGVHTKHRFRLDGINTPEIHSKDAIEKAAGNAARAALADLLSSQGTSVTFTTVKDKTEKFGRYLVKITLANGLCVNDALVAAGHAKLYTGGKR